METPGVHTRVVRALGATFLAVTVAACGGGGGGGETGSAVPGASAGPADGAVPVATLTGGTQEVLAAAGAAAAPAATVAPTRSPLRAAAGNLLSNPDFEAGMTGWVDWGNALVVDGAGAGGSWRALRVGPAAGGAGHDVAGGILPGTRYRLTGQARVSDPSDTVYIGVNILDQWNSVIAQQAVPAIGTAYSLATLEIEAPAGAAKAVVFVWKNAGAGQAFVDDLALVPAAAAAPAAAGNLLVNGGFESALQNWTNWGNAAAVAGQAAAGASAVQVGNGAGGLGQDVFTIVAGRTYSLGGQVKVSDAWEVAYLGVSFFDAVGTKLLEQNVPVSSTSYAATRLDLAAPWNAARAMVYLWKNAGSGFAYADEVTLAPLDGGTATPAPAPAPAPAPPPPVDVGLVPLGMWPTTLLQAGYDHDAYWVEDGVWAAWGLARGGYTGRSGLNYEQYTGVSPKIGPNGEVAFRMAWKWPICCNEIKSFPSIVSGRKPGWYNSWTKPGGLDVLLPGGGYSQTYPSGATPGTFLPLQLPLASLKTSFDYRHLTPPTGRGHLAYDIFLQNTPAQASGFGANITHEIIIPLDYWGGYGQYPTRNPAWYDHDVTIDGILFHVYAAKGADGVLRADFNGGWKFIVFEPDRPIPPGTLDLAKFVNYVTTRRDAAGTPWAWGTEYAVSVELGVEPEEGVGDIQVSNYRVWR